MIKRVVFLYLFIFSFSFGMGQKHSAYYEQRVALFEKLPPGPDDIIFIGNSITNGCEWAEMFGNSAIKNRGINGDIAEGVHDRLPTTLKGEPRKMFLMIGVNDIARGTTPDSVIRVVRKIIDRIQLTSPRTKLYVESALPVNNHYMLFDGHMDKGEQIIEYNRKLESLCVQKKVAYIDLYRCFKNENDEKLNLKYTNDGLHLMAEGYLLWKEILLPSINE